MSAVAFGNGGGWVRWRTMDAAERERQETRAAEAIADMLADSRRHGFPDHPVVLDGAEVPWEICDTAFGFARSMGGDAPMFDRWLACLGRARRYIEGQQAAFVRGGDPLPVSDGPPRFERERDRDALARLEVQLVLETPRAPVREARRCLTRARRPKRGSCPAAAQEDVGPLVGVVATDVSWFRRGPADVSAR